MTLRDFQRDFNKNFKKNFNHIADFAEQLLTDVAEQLEEGKTKALLNSALDLVKPHFLSLGARVSVLSANQVELLLPKKSRNIDEFENFLPGILISSAIEAYKMLWTRTSPAGEFQIEIKEAHALFLKAAREDLTIRGEISDLTRESRWAELQKDKRSQHQMIVNLYDKSNQLVAEVDIKAEFLLKELIDWK